MGSRLLRVLLLIFAVLVSACASSYSGSGPYTAEDPPGQREHKAFRAKMEAQPQFSEDELLKFIADSESVKDLPADKVMNSLVTEKGWSIDRATYMLLKVGMVAESFRAKRRYSEMFPAIPPSLYPSREETSVARKHLDRITKLFVQTPQPRRTPEGAEDKDNNTRASAHL